MPVKKADMIESMGGFWLDAQHRGKASDMVVAPAQNIVVLGYSDHGYDATIGRSNYKPRGYIATVDYSDPSQPSVVKDRLEMPFDTRVNWQYMDSFSFDALTYDSARKHVYANIVASRKTYIATLDISDPANPTTLQKYHVNTMGGSYGRQANGVVFDAVNQRLLIAMGGSGNDYDFMVANVNDNGIAKHFDAKPPGPAGWSAARGFGYDAARGLCFMSFAHSSDVEVDVLRMGEGQEPQGATSGQFKDEWP
jgi:hypothetical protein